MPSNTPVTQADREAAADFMDQCSPYLGDCGMKNSVQLALVQLLARHRQSSSNAGGVDARAALERAAEHFQEITQITAGCATSHGDDGGGLQMSNAVASEGWNAATEALASLSTPTAEPKAREAPEENECVECGWQGPFVRTDAGVCPECGGEVAPISAIYGSNAAPSDLVRKALEAWTETEFFAEYDEDGTPIRYSEERAVALAATHGGDIQLAVQTTFRALSAAAPPPPTPILLVRNMTKDRSNSYDR